MTPEERNGIITQMKRQMNPSGNVAMEAAIEVFTNPFVIMGIVLSPVGGTALRAGGEVFDMAAKATPFLRESAGFLGVLGSKSPLQVLRGTATAEMLHDMEQQAKNLAYVFDFESGYADAAKKVTNRLRAKTLDLRHTNNPQVERLMYAIHGSLEGWDRTVTRKVLKRGKKTGAEKWVDRTVEPLVNVNLDDEIRAIAGDDGIALRDAMRKAMDLRTQSLILKDDAVGRKTLGTMTDADWRESLDANKLVNLYGAMNTNKRLIDYTPTETLAATVNSLMSPTALSKLQAKTPSDIVDHFVKEVIPGFVQDGYMPRNQRNLIDTATGNAVSPSAAAAWQRSNQLQPTSRQNVRTQAASVYDEQTLRKISDYFGQGSGYSGALSRAIETASRPGARVAYDIVNPTSALAKFNRETLSTAILHVNPLSDEVMSMVAKNNASPELLAKFKEAGIDKVTEANAIGGRPSMAAVIADELPAMEAAGSFKGDVYARRMVTEFVLPWVTGTVEPRVALSHVGGLGARRGFHAMLKGPFGKMLGKEHGQRFVNALEETFVGEDPLRGKGLSGGVASFLYSTHLGVNPGSILLNVSQPILGVAPMLGVESTMVGYFRAIGDLIRYGKEKARSGWFFGQNHHARSAAIKRAFPYAEQIGLGDEFLDAAESAARASFSPDESMFQRVVRWTMIGFEKGEWLNRATAAHALAHSYRRAGLARSGPQFTRDLRNIVLETQFPSSMANTPVMFQSGGKNLAYTGSALSSPILKQFLPFVTRSFVMPLAVAPHAGKSVRQIGLFGIPIAETTSVGVARTFDIIRMTAMSAAAFEVGKTIFQRDISRGLFFNSFTGILGADNVAYDDNPLPLPPALSIPYAAIKGGITGDTELLLRTATRLVPGGIWASKVDAATFGAVNPLEFEKPIVATRFADWKNPNADGQIPIYRRSGELIRYEDPKWIVMQAAGLDIGRPELRSQAERYLQANVQQIRAYRQQVIDAIIANNPDKARRIKEEAERRYNVPLVIDQQMIRNRIKRKEEETSAHILHKQLPPEFRDAFKDLVPPESGAMNAGQVGTQPSPAPNF